MTETPSREMVNKRLSWGQKDAESWETSMYRQRGERDWAGGVRFAGSSPGQVGTWLLSYSPGLAVGLGLGVLAEAAKKSLPGGHLQSGE